MKELIKEIAKKEPVKW